MSRAGDHKLPGGTLTFGEVKERYGQEFADKAFELMERWQAGEGAAFTALMDLYFDWAAENEGKDHLVIDPSQPGGYKRHPAREREQDG